jgi:hypothetical protein
VTCRFSDISLSGLSLRTTSLFPHRKKFEDLLSNVVVGPAGALFGRSQFTRGRGVSEKLKRLCSIVPQRSPGDRLARTVGFFSTKIRRWVTQRCCALRWEPFPEWGVMACGTGPAPQPLTPSARPIESRSPGALIFMAAAVVREQFPIGTGFHVCRSARSLHDLISNIQVSL